MKSVAIALLALAVFAVAAPLFSDLEYINHFRGFESKFQKKFSKDERPKRFEIFKTNLDFITSQNKLHKSYTLAVNEFADLTRQEFLEKMGIRRIAVPARSHFVVGNHKDILPDEIDWRQKGAVTPMKDQAQCGSCWGFSAVGGIEGAVAVATGKLVSLSEQELVDCSSDYGNWGCMGGLMDYAFQYVIDHGGLCREEDYAYTAMDGECQADTCEHVSKIKGFVDVQANELALKAAVVKQPISVAIQADTWSFQFYHGGVFDDPECQTYLDHGVTLVGYGAETGKDGNMFWIVKNSWGTSWGEDGYIRFIRKDSATDVGMCGIAMWPSFPVAA